MNWKEWIHKLIEFEIGIHLMRTHAAGTFALNCAYLGIPCIGYKEADTQRILHPELSVEIGNLEKARKLINKLKTNEDFYNKCSEECLINWKENFNEASFLNHMNKVLL